MPHRAANGTVEAENGQWAVLSIVFVEIRSTGSSRLPAGIDGRVHAHAGQFAAVVLCRWIAAAWKRRSLASVEYCNLI